jgi:hypothetical protein
MGVQFRHFALPGVDVMVFEPPLFFEYFGEGIAVLNGDWFCHNLTSLEVVSKPPLGPNLSRQRSAGQGRGRREKRLILKIRYV